MFKIPKGNIISFDTEDTGLFWRRGDMPYCVSFCNEEGQTAVISFPVDPFTRTVKYTEPELAILKKFFFDTNITKIAHNASYDYGMLKSIGIRFRSPIICTMNLIRLVKSDAPIKLKPFCKQYLGIEDTDEKDLKEETRKARRKAKEKGWKIYEGNETEDGSLAPDYWLAPRGIVEKYAEMDAIRAMAVYQALYPEIEKQGLQKLWKKEKKVWRILRRIESRGVRVYREKVLTTKENLKKKLQTYQKKAHQITGQKINLNSSKQLREIFFKKLKQSPAFLTPSGLPSTDSDALKAIQHPLAKTILNIRACNKTIEFMDQYLFFMQKNEDGNYYIHPTINQAMAVTGRESCSNPNMQQVAGGENNKGVEVTVEARSVFGPHPGYHLRSYDWTGQEIYIPAFASEDPILTKILKEGGDVHQMTADNLTRITGQEITRYQAKRVFFGLQYGIGVKKLSKTLGLVDEEMAPKIISGFSESYPGLWSWMESLKNEAAYHGFIKTAYGRTIYMNPRDSYKAINYYVQGTAAGILKSAKIKIREWIKESAVDVHIVLPVHDELLIEIPEKHTHLEHIDRKVVSCMQDNPELKMPIPIPVSISEIGESWADKKKVRTI